MNWLKNERGLTLIEIMLVVIILGVLVALVVPQFSGRTEQARRAAANADINANIATALELYYMDNGVYPTTEQGLATLHEKSDIPPVPMAWNGPYLKKGSTTKDPWSEKYEYICPGDHNPESYDLFSKGPDRQPGGGDDICNWQQDDSGN